MEPFPFSFVGWSRVHRRDGETGRRAGLKILRGQPHPGSSPGPGTVSTKTDPGGHPSRSWIAVMGGLERRCGLLERCSGRSAVSISPVVVSLGRRTVSIDPRDVRPEPPAVQPDPRAVRIEPSSVFADRSAVWTRPPTVWREPVTVWTEPVTVRLTGAQPPRALCGLRRRGRAPSAAPRADRT